MDGAGVDGGALGKSVVFLKHFCDLRIHSSAAKKMYPLDEILLLCLLGVLAGAETIVDIGRFGEKKRELLRRFRPFRDGTPSHDSLDAAEASLNGQMINRSAVITVLADASKFGRRATYLVAPLTAASAVISDRQLEAGYRRRLAEAHCRSLPRTVSMLLRRLRQDESRARPRARWRRQQDRRGSGRPGREGGGPASWAWPRPLWQSWVARGSSWLSPVELVSVRPGVDAVQAGTREESRVTRRDQPSTAGSRDGRDLPGGGRDRPIHGPPLGGDLAVGRGGCTVEGQHPSTQTLAEKACDRLGKHVAPAVLR